MLFEFSNIRAFFFLLVHRACKILALTFFCETFTGIKLLGRRVSSKSSLPIIDTLVINPEIVFFFPDGLKNKYTLTSISMSSSPHLDLINKVFMGHRIIESEYIRREALGGLDGRFGLIVSKRSISNHVELTIKNRAALVNGSYKHPRLVCFEGKYYALDGKHRLAMAIYLNKVIECDIVSLKDLLRTNYVNGLLKKMQRRRSNYESCLVLLEEMERSISLK